MPDLKPGTRRAAVVELVSAHDEVLPSIFDSLIANGVEPTAFINARVRARGDVLENLAGHRGRVNYRDLELPKDVTALVEEIREGGFDLLVINTFALDGAGQLARRVGLPAIGVIHNVGYVTGSPQCVRALRTGLVQPAVLAPHVASSMMAQAPDLFASVVVLGAWMFDLPEELRRTRTDGPRQLVVPGGVDLRNRDHDLLLRLLPEIVEEVGPDRFEVAVVGGGADRLWLEEQVAQRDLGHLVTFAPLDPGCGSVLSRDLYPAVAGADALLTLLPDHRGDYRTSKISAAISSSIGFTVPAVVDRWTSTVYDLPGLTYTHGGLASGIVRAVTADDDELASVRDRLVERRHRERERAAEGMAQALDALGRPPMSDAQRAGTRSPTSPEPAAATGATGATGAAGAGEASTVTGSGASYDPAAIDRDDDKAFLAFALLARTRSHAQRLQDLWALWESGFALDGSYCEFGALNGRDYSNTYLLERLGWQGVVAEPHPDYAEVLHASRRCYVSTKCVHDHSGGMVTFHAVRGRPALSTIAGYGQDARSHLRAEYVEHHVPTITLSDLLDEAGAPAVVDYLSIDTEGSELTILGAHDFEARPIRLLSVEHNDLQRDALHELLTDRGYRRKWAHLSGHDDWYVLEGAYPDWSALALPDAVAAVSRAPEYSRNNGDLVTLVDNLRISLGLEARDLAVPLPALDEPPALTGAAAEAARQGFRHTVAMHRQLTDDTAAVTSRKLVRLFARLGSALEVDSTVEIGPLGGPAGNAAARLVGRRPSSKHVVLDVGTPAPGPPRPDEDVPRAGRERAALVWSPLLAGDDLVHDAERLLSAAVLVLVPPWPEDSRWTRRVEERVAAQLGLRGLVAVAGEGLAHNRSGGGVVRRTEVGHPAVARLVARVIRGERAATS